MRTDTEPNDTAFVSTTTAAVLLLGPEMKAAAATVIDAASINLTISFAKAGNFGGVISRPREWLQSFVGNHFRTNILRIRLMHVPDEEHQSSR